MGQKWPYLAKKASFGPNFAVFGPKILIFYGSKQKFGTIITEKPPRQLVRTVFWSGIWSNEPKKIPIFGQKCQKSIFGGGWSKTFGTLIWGNQRDTFSVSKTLTHWPVWLQLAARDENVQFWPKNLDICGQKSIFCMVITIFVNRAYHEAVLHLTVMFFSKFTSRCY